MSFDWVKMNKKDIVSAKERYLSHKKEQYKKIKDILPEERTFKNTVLGIVNSDGEYADLFLQIHLLSQVSPIKELRDVASQIESEVRKELVDIEFDRDVYIALEEYEMGNYSEEKLDTADKKLFTDLVRSYRRMGFDLPLDKQKELKKKIKELSTLSTNFRKNINEYDDHILCTREELAGCADRFIDSLKKVKSDNKDKEEILYKVTLAYPHIGPFMANAIDRAKRKELAIKNSKKGGKQNLALLKKMVTIRIQIAKLLGYKNYIDFKVEDRMAKDSKTVISFVDNLLKQTAPLAKRDVSLLKSYAKKCDINDLQSFDLAFVGDKYSKEMFGLDFEALRAYFPLGHIIKTMFGLSERLFAVTFKKINTELWHKDAMHFEVRDKKTKKLLSHLLLDLYPRTGKYGHAAAFDTRYKGGEKIVTLVCNFPSPSAKHPSLLSVGEVETLYHEFGHALHFMLSDTKYPEHNGFNVAWDFVEAPSQMLENFVWRQEALKMLSHHYETGKSLNYDTITRLLESKKFLVGMDKTRQFLLAKLDLDIHLDKAGNYDAYYKKLSARYIPIPPLKESLFPASFGHLDGYDSGYYSYMWALVYAQDFFSIFERAMEVDKKKKDKKEVELQKVGERYRKEILGVGSSREEVISAEKFLRRKMNTKAFLKEIGLEK